MSERITNKRRTVQLIGAIRTANDDVRRETIEAADYDAGRTELNAALGDGELLLSIRVNR